MNKEFGDKLDIVMARLLPFGTKEWVSNLHKEIWDAGFRLGGPSAETNVEEFKRVCRERDDTLMALDRDYWENLANEREKAFKLAEEAELRALASYHKAEAELSQAKEAERSAKATSYYDDWTRCRDEATRLEKANADLTECNNRLSAELFKHEQALQALREQRDTLRHQLHVAEGRIMDAKKALTTPGAGK